MRSKVAPRVLARSAGLAVWLSLSLTAAIAHAQEVQSQAEPAARPSYWVDFEAGRVIVDPEKNVLELEQNVAIKVHRYRLTSDRLVLERGPRGIVVDGDGRVAFCPCPDPPVTIGFSAATVAPPTDLIIEDPTLRVGDVPIFWLPYMWLRAPDRLGLLPPRVAWRGEDGLLLGSGVHVPLGDLDAVGEADAIDLYASGYLQGGVELDGRMVTESTSTRVRFDHLRQSLLAVDAHGALTERSSAALAWRMDAIRGQRGRRGTLALEEASRRYDRAEIAGLGAQDGIVLGVGARAAAARGGDLDQPGRGGPIAHAGIGSALAEVGSVDFSLAAESSDADEGGSASLGEQRGELALAARPGPIGAELALAEGALVDSRSEATGVVGWVGGRARLGLPLVREFGGSDPLVHRVEPFARGSGRWVSQRGDVPIAEPLDLESTAAASGGIRTTLGRYGARTSGTLELEGGAAGPVDSIEPAVAARALADAGFAALGSSAHWMPEQDGGGVATGARARLGRVDALHLSVAADGQSGDQIARARLLGADFDLPRTELYDQRGWMLGGELGVPFAVWLASAVGADYDLTGEELLGVRGSLGYRHPCGCLAALAWAGHRLGREGVDAWLTVDLLP